LQRTSFSELFPVKEGWFADGCLDVAGVFSSAAVNIAYTEWDLMGWNEQGLVSMGKIEYCKKK